MPRFTPAPLEDREFDWGTVRFVDKKTIRVITPQYSIVFHRWYAPLGTYRQWARFRARLANDRQLDLPKIYKIACKYEITNQISRFKFE